MTPIALTIAGSDSSGGAGIQADLKTFSALGAYGCSVVTALTAQNTRGVQGISDVEPDFITQQLSSVFSDLAVQAVKIGMLSRKEVIQVVVEAVEKYQVTRLVVDPVMVATSGDLLLQRDAIDILIQELIPRASLITPNLPEAAVLLDAEIPTNRKEMEQMVGPLLALGPRAVLLKGGHLQNDESVDLFHDGHQIHWLTALRIKTLNTHGTGCTLSAAIAALLARGYGLKDAVYAAKDYISNAIATSDQLHVGHGNGPVHHFHNIWPH